MQRQAHVSRADAFHVAALLDHGQQDVVALVQQRKLVPDFFQLQRNRLRILHLCHVIEFSLGLTILTARNSGYLVPRAASYLAFRLTP